MKLPHIFHKYEPIGRAFIAYHFPPFMSKSGLRTVGICQNIKCKCGKEKQSIFQMKFNGNLTFETIEKHIEAMEKQKKDQ